MIEGLYQFKYSRTRQIAAPLLNEREQYLSHLLELGFKPSKLRSTASMLLNVVRLLDLSSLDTVDIEKVFQASERWLNDPVSDKKWQPGYRGPDGFTRTALSWLRFHGKLDEHMPAPTLIELLMGDFRVFLRDRRGMLPPSVLWYGIRAKVFLRWTLSIQKDLSSISMSDIDAFLDSKRAAGCLPKTITSYCTCLRMFFKFAEIRGLNSSQLEKCIRNPRSHKGAAACWPSWKDVRRLLKVCDGSDDPRDLRAAAILSLCSIYGLRSSETTNLKLNDFDWISETFTVRRAKGFKIQQFPIQLEVGEKILRYLQYGRPRCSCRNLFVKLKPPYLPVTPGSVWELTSERMRLLGVKSSHRGAHSLRHSCATQLLRTGSSLASIADFLGHSNTRSVSIYAKFDPVTLRRVAEFSLAGVK